MFTDHFCTLLFFFFVGIYVSRLAANERFEALKPPVGSETIVLPVLSTIPEEPSNFSTAVDDTKATEFRPTFRYIGRINTKSYYMDKTLMTFKEAEDLCLSMKMKSAIFETDDEIDFVYDRSEDFGNDLWTGAVMNYDYSNFKWKTNGKKLNVGTIWFSNLEDMGLTFLAKKPESNLKGFFAVLHLNTRYPLCYA